MEKKKKKKKSRSSLFGPGTVAILILSLLLLGAMGGSLLYLNAQMNAINTVYPGVSVNGVELSNLRYDEAEKVLNDLEEGAYQGFSVSVLLPLDTTLTLTKEEAQLQLYTGDALSSAWNYGRTGKYSQRLLTFIRHRYLGAKAVLQAENSRTVNEEHIRELVNESVSQLNSKLIQTGYRIGKYSINIRKGAFAMQVDQNKIADALIQAVLDADPTPIIYQQDMQTDEGVDLEKLHQEICRESISSVYDPATSRATPSQKGISFDIDEAKRLWTAASYGEIIAIPLITIEPDFTEDQLNALLFRDILGEKTTPLAGSTANRINNVAKACEKLSAITLQPGETFSYNECLGERTAANGWYLAGAYADGQVVEEYGGGICQVSSTLFVSCLLADVKINTRSCHHFPVSYLPAGLDATVSWGGPEYKFTNDTPYPLRINAFVSENRANLTIQLIGTDLDHNTVEICYSPIEEFEAEDKTMVDNNGNVVTVGYRITTWCKVYSPDGKLLKGGNGDYRKYFSSYNYHEEEIQAKLATPTIDEPVGNDGGGFDEAWW